MISGRYVAFTKENPNPTEIEISKKLNCYSLNISPYTPITSSRNPLEDSTFEAIYIFLLPLESKKGIAKTEHTSLKAAIPRFIYLRFLTCSGFSDILSLMSSPAKSSVEKVFKRVVPWISNNNTKRTPTQNYLL